VKVLVAEGPEAKKMLTEVGPVVEGTTVTVKELAKAAPAPRVAPVPDTNTSALRAKTALPPTKGVAVHDTDAPTGTAGGQERVTLDGIANTLMDLVATTVLPVLTVRVTGPVVEGV